MTGRITALKDMGFSLADIIRILALHEDQDAIESYLIKKQKELLETSAVVQYRLKLIENARKRMKEEI